MKKFISVSRTRCVESDEDLNISRKRIRLSTGKIKNSDMERFLSGVWDCKGTLFASGLPKTKIECYHALHNLYEFVFSRSECIKVKPDLKDITACLRELILFA